MEDLNLGNAPIQAVSHHLLEEADVSFDVLRLDLVHPHIHGNKWFKLKHNLDQLRQSGARRVLSFGGAWSNHLYALAAAGKHFELETIGVIRGELVEPLNPVLDFAKKQGMQLIPVSREDYRRKTEKDFIDRLHQQLGDFYLIPEGGSNALALKGCEEIADLILQSSWRESRDVTGSDYVALACGTGMTMAGLISGFSKSSAPLLPELLGFSVLKGEGYLSSEVSDYLADVALQQSLSWRMLEDYHCGGYAKTDGALRKFLQEFSGFSDIPIEPVYTGKVFFGLFEMIKQGQFEPGSRILALHTGGIPQ